MRVVKVILALLLVIGVALLVVKTWVIQMVLIQGNDMAPGLQEGDVAFVNLLQRAPEAGEVVLFRSSDGHLVLRRVIGLPGERFRYRAMRPEIEEVPVFQLSTGMLKLPRDDGRSGKDTYHVVKERVGRQRYEVLHDIKRMPNDIELVKLGGYFTLSDNRDHGADSREFGEVAPSQIRGTL